MFFNSTAKLMRNQKKDVRYYAGCINPDTFSDEMHGFGTKCMDFLRCVWVLLFDFPELERRIKSTPVSFQYSELGNSKSNRFLFHWFAKTKGLSFQTALL
jgi:hypothetical protein